jgi:hypothetical protein
MSSGLLKCVLESFVIFDSKGISFAGAARFAGLCSALKKAISAD